MDQRQDEESLGDNHTLSVVPPETIMPMGTLLTIPPLFDIKRATKKPETWCCIKLIAPSHDDRPWTSDDAIGAWCTVCNLQIHFKKGSINSVARHMKAKHQKLMDDFKEAKSQQDSSTPVGDDDDADSTRTPGINSNGKRSLQNNLRGFYSSASKSAKTEQANEARAGTTPTTITIDDSDAEHNLTALQGSGVEADDQIFVKLNQLLLEAVATKNRGMYSKLCADDLTCIVPESNGLIIKGHDFHRYLFLASSVTTFNVFMTNTHVKRMGDHAAMISYNCVQQRKEGPKVMVETCSETRNWQLMDDGKWRCIHFHRS